MKYAIALALLLTSSIANAEFSIAGGFDIQHDQGRPYAEVRYFGEDWRHWSAYVGTDNTVGIELYTSLFGIELGWGVEYANSGDQIVSTPLAYQLRFEYPINDTWDVGLKHRSNCKKVCNNDLLDWVPHGEQDSWNNGYNFLYLRHRF